MKISKIRTKKFFNIRPRLERFFSKEKCSSLVGLIVRNNEKTLL